MGCVASRQVDDNDVVSVCKERKRLLKLAVEGRYAFADAQCKYNQSLSLVAEAIRVFVSRHSSPSSPFLITFASSSDSISNETIQEKSTTEPTNEEEEEEEPISCQSSSSSSSQVSLTSSDETEKENQEHKQNNNNNNHTQLEECDDNEVGSEHFYDEVGSTMATPSEREFQSEWDFFSPIDEKIKIVREKEGIDQEPEEIGERNEFVVGDQDKNGVSDGVSCLEEETNELKVIETPAKKGGRELLDALKDVEDHFTRAYESGLDVSRMLEVNRVQLQTGLVEFKGSSNKLIRTFTWNRSTSSRSSSCKSLITSSSKSSFTWTESKNDLLDDYGGMESGSHSSTLGRLYVWEKKLYEEVKTGEETRKLYERKCLQLRNKDAKRDGSFHVDKTRVEVKALHSKILVSIRSAESISDRIEKLRDEELHPQLVELLHGLMRLWKIMSESHEIQQKIMFEVTSFDCPAYGRFRNDSHRLATCKLEAELRNWRVCFAEYVSSQKAYIKAIHGWLSMFIAPEIEFYSKESPPMPQCRVNRPPLLVLCHDWLSCLEKLPDKEVLCAMRSFGKNIRGLWVQQGEEQQQKRKVDGLAKELDRRGLAFQKAESKILGAKHLKEEPEVNVRNQIDYLAERKNLLEMFKNRVEREKAKHLSSMKETHNITVNGFQTGFSSVFETLTEFSKASVKMYADLVTYSENAKVTTVVEEELEEQVTSDPTTT